MDSLNLWILIPFVLFFALVAIPVIYIWIHHYAGRWLCCTSKQNAKNDEASEVATGTTEAPEQLASMAQSEVV